SLAQAYHGTMLAGLAAILAGRLRRFPPSQRFLLVAAAGFAASVAVSLAFRLLGGPLPLEDLVAGLQVAYWLVLWPTVLVVCRSDADCRRVLAGVALAGVYAALSVIYFYVVGGQAASPYPDIAASAGGLHTAKGLGGILITGCVCAAWLSGRRFKLLGSLAVVVCLAGLFLTYQRAGLVAMLLALAWLAVWYLVGGRSRPDADWAGRLLVVAGVALVAILAVIGTSDLQKRWQDLPDLDKAGSARIAFWRVALEHYGALSPAEKVFGIGYAALAEAMANLYGSRIHTHSDVLDVLVMFGLLGLGFWLGVQVAALRMIWRCRSAGPLFAASLAVYLVMLSEGVLTGQILAPHVMGVYLMSLACWYQLAGPHGGLSPAGPPRPGCRTPMYIGAPGESGQGGGRT
ncbi:MAG: hypothetical protein AMJ81_05410, partial [Phycisphaerae bacterium SM23_33]